MGIEERKRKEKLDRHNSILKAAEKIMLIGGLHALNMDRVAQESELAKGTLYIYFKNKEEILAELSLKARNLLFQEFEKALQTQPTSLEKIKAILETNYHFHKKYPLYYDLVSLYEINNQFTETPELQASSYKITQLIISLVENAQRDGSLRDGIDPMLFSMAIWGMTVGIIQFIKVRGPLIQKFHDIEEQDVLKAYLDLLENGYKN